MLDGIGQFLSFSHISSASLQSRPIPPFGPPTNFFYFVALALSPPSTPSRPSALHSQPHSGVHTYIGWNSDYHPISIYCHRTYNDVNTQHDFILNCGSVERFSFGHQDAAAARPPRDLVQGSALRGYHVLAGWFRGASYIGSARHGAAAQ